MNAACVHAERTEDAGGQTVGWFIVTQRDRKAEIALATPEIKPLMRRQLLRRYFG